MESARNHSHSHFVAVSRVAVSALAAILIGAGPATKPADPKPADRNTTEYTAAPVDARFRVPKTWQKREIQGGIPDKMFLFDPAPASKKPSLFLQLIEVYLDRPQASQKTQADVVDALRAALIKKTPDLKFTKDAALNYAGRTAWILQWTQQSKVTIAPAAGGPPKESTMESDRAEILFLEHDTICQFGLFADPGFMPTLIKKSEIVAKTVTWDK